MNINSIKLAAVAAATAAVGAASSVARMASSTVETVAGLASSVAHTAIQYLPNEESSTATKVAVGGSLLIGSALILEKGAEQAAKGLGASHLTAQKVRAAMSGGIFGGVLAAVGAALFGASALPIAAGGAVVLGAASYKAQALVNARAMQQPAVKEKEE